MAKRVGIIGAGAAGLSAAKSCLEAGLVPLCFEQSLDIGGLWNYRTEVKEGEPSLYNSIVINTCKEMTCFSDFPMPKDFPNYMGHKDIKRYFDLYAQHFGLRQHISFQHTVQSVDKCPDFDLSGQWEMVAKDLKTGKNRKEVVDFVMVCNGHLHEPNVPKQKGLESFRGRVLHTRDYKDFRGFEDKRVLVVGIGNSGSDVACELSRHAKHVHISTRRGSYIIQRAGEYGHPFDQVAIQRWVQKMPWSLMRPVHFNKINYKYKHNNYGLAPNFRFDAGAVTISDDLPNRILTGSISVHDNVSHFTATSAVLEDGTVIEDLDVVIMATGFKFSFPFLKAETVKVEGHFPHLYQLVFPPNIQPCSLAVIGLVQPFGALPPILEMQARTAVAMFSGRSQLPAKSAMDQWLVERKAFLAAKYVDSPRYTIQIYFIQYMDALAKLIGCEPRLWRYLLTNPKLWYKLVFGPATPPQWRLDGPGSWSGAQEAVEMVQEKTYFPMKTRQSGQGERDGLYDGWIALAKWMGALLLLLFLSVSYVF